MPYSESGALLVATVILTAYTVLGADIRPMECWSDQMNYGPLVGDLWNGTPAHSNVHNVNEYCPSGFCYMALIRSNESIQVNFGCVRPKKDAEFKRIRIKAPKLTSLWYEYSSATPRSAKYYCSVLSSTDSRPCNNPLVISNAIGEAKRANNEVFNNIGIFMRAREEGITKSIYFSTEKDEASVQTPVTSPEASNSTDHASASEDETNEKNVPDDTVQSEGIEQVANSGDSGEPSLAMETTNPDAAAAASAGAGDDTEAVFSDGTPPAPMFPEKNNDSAANVTVPTPNLAAESDVTASANSTEQSTNASKNTADSEDPDQPLADGTPASTFPEITAEQPAVNAMIPGHVIDSDAATKMITASSSVPAAAAATKVPSTDGPNAAAATGLSLAGVSMLAVIRLF